MPKYKAQFGYGFLSDDHLPQHLSQLNLCIANTVPKKCCSNIFLKVFSRQCHSNGPLDTVTRKKQWLRGSVVWSALSMLAVVNWKSNGNDAQMVAGFFGSSVAKRY